MYRLLIVEDEELLRKAMCVMIDWGDIGITVVGAVENGIKAMEFLENCQTDIVVTDIRMPSMDGLELACELKVKYPSIKTVLCSAYSEFQFAQKGIEYGVYGYLLKSQDEDEIAEYFRSMCKKMDEEQVYTLRNTHTPTYKPEMWENREKLFIELVEQNCPLSDCATDEILKKAAEYKMNLTEQSYMILLIQIDEAASLRDEIGEISVRGLRKILAEQCLINVEWSGNGYLVSYNETIVIIWNNFEEDYRSKIKNLQDTLCSELDLFEVGSALSISIALGDRVSDIKLLYKSYQSATKLLLNKFYLGCGNIIDNTSIASVEKSSFSNETISRYLQKIDKLCYEEKTDEILNSLDEIKQEWIETGVTDRNAIENFCMRLLLIIEEPLKKRFHSNDYSQSKSMELIRIVARCETMESIFVQMKLFCQDMFDAISLIDKTDTQTIHQPKKLVEKALDYMKENFANDISLDKVAQYVNVHPVHLSRLFRQETSQTFKSILTQLRIDAAKLLLEDLDLRIYEISEKVGYKKPRYFSELFKEVTGRTPLEYRESH